jgi:HD-GYP domain-containing protein (c-di-GMP phosphodiesterase class II)
MAEEKDAVAQAERSNFLGTFVHRIGNIEREIPRIARRPDNQEAAQSLLKATNQVCADAVRYQLGSVVALLRGVEGLAQAMADRRLTFVPGVGEAILLALDRARLVAESDAPGSDAGEIGRAAQELATVAAQGDSARDAAIARAIQELAGGDSWNSTAAAPEIPAPAPVAAAPVVSRGPFGEDLRTFRELSLRLERRSAPWEGRTDRLVRFALEANAEAGHLVDPRQLEAAIYMHDFGMAFLSESFWKKQGPLSASEWRELQEHPALGAKVLERMSRWEEAAKMVAQHHERPSGKGYPRGLKEDEITPGAQLIAILDAFEAMTHDRADRPSRKSVMRAIAEINACVDQFSRGWVKIFNRVVRRMLNDPERAAELPPDPKPR